MKSDYIQVLVSCESTEQAKTMADVLLKEHLIACAQIVPKVESLYRWQGQIETAEECLMLLKTIAAHYDLIEQIIKKRHNYATPEIIAVPLIGGSTEYLDWINEQTEQKI